MEALKERGLLGSERNGHSPNYIPPVQQKVGAQFPFYDDGRLVLIVERLEPGRGGRPKEFRPKHPTADGQGFHFGLGGKDSKCGCPRIEPPLYRQDELKAAPTDQPVFAVEGEAKADALRALGFVATSALGGAGRKWEPRYSDLLEDREVIVLPDNDDPGRKHAADVAGRSLGKAGMVKVLDLPGLQEKGDIIDWLALGRTGEELTELACKCPEWDPGSQDSTAKPLRFLTAAEIASQTPEDVQYILKPYLIQGATTELDGKIKLAGKTTFALAMVEAVVTGGRFLGEPTIQTPVVYLTEQPPSSFREALRRANLLSEENLIILPYFDTVDSSWNQVIDATYLEMQQRGAKLLVVDTLPQFAGLKGDAENSAGDALEAIQPLQRLAAQGMCVMIVRHDRKAGGDVGDSARGSSAFGGAVDIILSLRRGDGNSPPTVRVIQGVGRFDGIPDKLIVDYKDGQYVSLGTETQVVKSQTREAILEVIPEDEGDALSTRDILDKAEDVKKTLGKEIIKELFDAKVIQRKGEGKSGKPFLFWQSSVDRSEATVLAANRPARDSETTPRNDGNVGWPFHKEEVPTDRLLGPENSEDVRLESRSVGSPSLYSGQPTFGDNSDPETLEF